MAVPISILVAGFLIGGAVLFTNSKTRVPDVPADNVTTVDGTQIVTLGAKGGYAPRVSEAKAGVPTTLRVQTNGTFDCTAVLSIPSIGYRGNLPPSGTTDIPLPAQEPGSVLRGTCAMGMKHFQIRFN